MTCLFLLPGKEDSTTTLGAPNGGTGIDNGGDSNSNDDTSAVEPANTLKDKDGRNDGHDGGDDDKGGNRDGGDDKEGHNRDGDGNGHNDGNNCGDNQWKDKNGCHDNKDDNHNHNNGGHHDNNDNDHDHNGGHHHNDWCDQHDCHHHNHHTSTHFSGHEGNVTVKINTKYEEKNPKNLDDVDLIIGDVYEKTLDLSDKPSQITVEHLDIDGGDDFAVCLANEDSQDGECTVATADSDHSTETVYLTVK